MLFRRLVPSFVLLAFAPIATGLGGCGGQNAASQVLKTPELPTDKQAKCHISKSQSEPLIVEWPDQARARLESMSRKGLVAVKYDGCELAVLTRCTVKSSGYGYSGVTRRVNKLTIKDADDLYLKMPIGAVSLESKLKSAGALTVQTTTVGRYESPTDVLYREDLSGDCAEATHVIHALTVGSFTFSAGADAEVGGGASVGTAGGGAKSTATRETIQRDGDEAACSTSSLVDKKPPEGCGGPFQIEVMAVTRTPKPVVAAVVVPVPVPVPAPAPTPAPTAAVTPPLPPVKPAVKPPKCKRGERIEDGLCVKIAKGGVKPPVTKPTVASAALTCASGQHSFNNRCVDDEPPPPEPAPPPPPPPPAPSCTSGTHLDSGACVADEAPPAPTPYTPNQPYAADADYPNPFKTVCWYTAIGSGLVALTTGGLALSAASEAKKLCTSGTCPPEYDEKRSAAVTAGIITDVALGLAVLSVVGILFLPSKVKVSVAPSPHGVLVGTGWSFR